MDIKKTLYKPPLSSSSSKKVSIHVSDASMQFVIDESDKLIDES